MDNNELLHWGIKGMKWGVRRFQNKDGSLTPEGKKRYKDEMDKLRAEEKAIKTKEATKAKIAKLDAKRKELDERKRALDDDTAPKPVSKPKRKSIRDMSETEIRDKMARLQLEKDLKDLENKTRSKGKAFVEDVLETAGKNIATQFTAYVLGTAVNKGAEAIGYKNATKTVKNKDGSDEIIEIFEDIVNPRKGQKDK